MPYLAGVWDLAATPKAWQLFFWNLIPLHKMSDTWRCFKMNIVLI